MVCGSGCFYNRNYWFCFVGYRSNRQFGLIMATHPRHCWQCEYDTPDGAPFCPYCGCSGCAPRDPGMAGRVSGMVRRCHADERDANILLMRARGFSRDGIIATLRATGFRCSRSTYYACLVKQSNELMGTGETVEGESQREGPEGSSLIHEGGAPMPDKSRSVDPVIRNAAAQCLTLTRFGNMRH